MICYLENTLKPPDPSNVTSKLKPADSVSRVILVLLLIIISSTALLLLLLPLLLLQRS